MKALVAQGILLLAGIEMLMMLLHHRRFLLAAAGIAVAFLVLGVRRLLAVDRSEPSPGEAADEAGESLRHWRSSTEAKIRRSESTRTDWDRHWRPVLASRFEVSSGMRRSKNPAAFAAAGQMLLGSDLWPWVDPVNVADVGNSEPGPGRAVLEQILRRMELQ